MHSSLGSRPNIRARNSVFSGVKDGCWFYNWFQVHSFILLIKALFRPLIKQDLFNLKEQFWPETLYIKFGRLKKINPHHSAAKIIYELIKVDMIIACVLAFFEAGSNFAGPIIMRYILIFLNSPADKTTTTDRNTAFALAGLWIVFCVIEILLKQYWTRLSSLCATKIEVILETQFYRQTTRVSSTYKKYMSLGDFYSFWFVDVTNITAFIINFPTIVSAPTTLIFSVIFVCIEVGPYGLLLLAVIVLAIIIELLIDLKMSSIFAHKLSKYDLKLAENMHMYKEFKQMKQLGWESLIIKQNIRYRHPENRLNKIYYILGQIYLAITNFAPVLIIFILIVVGAYSENHITWGTTVIFTVIGYISTISIPLRNLPNIVSRLLVTRRVFKRIDNFLSAEEIQSNEDPNLQQGSFTIKKWVLSIGTRSSIDRLLVRESIMIEGEQSMTTHIKNLPIEVRMYHTLDFISRQEIKKFKELMKCIEVPYRLNYKKGDVVILLGQKSGSGKTSFIRGFLGSLFTRSGYLKYNGKLGFVSVRDFYLQKSIKENVLFGEYYNEQKLERAYRLSGLSQQLTKYTKGDSTIVTTNPNVIAQSLRCIISLARAIYYDSDIILMDDLFDEFEIDELKTLYTRICTNLSDKLIVLSTNLIHFLKASDNVIILENRSAVEVGKFGALISNPHSRIHGYRITDLQLIHYRSLISHHSSNDSISSQGSISESRCISYQSKLPQENKIKKQIKAKKQKRSTFNNVLTEASLYFMGEIKEDVTSQPPLPPTKGPLSRPTNVEWKYYFALFKNGGWMYVITFVFVCLANGVVTFSTWLIGSLARSPLGLNIDHALTLYACLQVLFAALLLIYGMFIPKVATLNIERMSNEFNDMIARSSLEQFQKFSSVHLNYVFGGDNHNFYNICDNITNVFNSFVALVSTIIIMGLASHYIYIVGGVVMLYSILVYYIFRISAQEIFVLGGGPKRYFFKALQDSVDGSETLQFYDKVEWFRSKVYDGIYMFSAVWRTNLRFINHAFNILCGIAELILMAGIMYLAIGKKQKFSTQSVIYVNVAVTASPRILGSIFILFNNLSNMAALINTTIKIPYECFNNKYQPNYNFPLKPANWPWNGKVELKQVSVERKEISYPLLDNINLTMEHGQVVGICSDYDNDVNLFFQLLNGLISPRKNDGGYAGDVIISDINISSLGQIYATEAVIVLDSNPLCFNGTVRFNTDPYNQYTDSEIEKALEAVKFWDEISPETDNYRFIEQFKTLNFVIEERGEQLSTAAVQKLNFARAYLRKPKILLLERAMNKIETSRYQFFYSMVRNLFRNSTIIMTTLDLHYLMRCDRVITFRKGKIIQEGHPRDLALNPKSRLFQMIEVLAHSDYLKKDSVKKSRH